MTRKPIDTPPQNVLLALLQYDTNTGILTWRNRTPEMFSSAIRCQQWNSRYGGKTAGSPKNGVWRTHLDGKCFLMHRLIWKMMTGDEPPDVIDHINGNQLDNKWSNLRGCTQAKNLQNVKIRNDNKTGYHGIHKKDWGAPYYARIGRKYLGCFDTFEDAYNARKKAEGELGYHQNHGTR